MTEPLPRATEPGRFSLPAPLGAVPLPDRFDLPAPPGVVPLPNVFPRSMTYVRKDIIGQFIKEIEQLPVTTEAILSANDRELALRILRTPFYFDNDHFIHVQFIEIVRPNEQDLALISSHQEKLEKAPTATRRNDITRWIANIQARVDERRHDLATRVRDNLALIQSYNVDNYQQFCEDRVQTMPNDISRGVRFECSVYMKDSLDYFAKYATYATHETLIRILDRVAYGLETTMYLYPVRMQRPRFRPEMGSNFTHQMHNLRDALRLVAVDPRAAPAINYYGLGVDRNAGPYGMYENDYNFFAAHMVRRARDRAWERVRARFAARLARWAVRYPQSRLAILATFPQECLNFIAVRVFPYTPYPN
jgi:hypothetical protein